ncbi:methyltransferase domain-containing protein [Streptomyces racemochromogenes]|uniref:Protein-L-isoaspartate O-methyltransferase n=1 Tax=Streptomyces racemochromogenes TaxID=67353 RepID=A0ABW7P947_9ACTN
MTLVRLDERRRALAEAMDAQGWPADSEWVRRAILETVPRHHFAPDRLWTWDGRGSYVPVEIGRHPVAWADLVYAGPNESTITQVLDGLPSSSLSCVAVVADMLDSLMLEPGHRVLEVGAGAGWNAALLAVRAGAGQVTTVEVDPLLAAAAERRLAAAGLDVAVHTGDGQEGWPAGAPYDRLIATYAVETVPWAWIEQTRPGGVIVFPWGRLGTIALTVAGDGKAATGWVHGLGMFMPSRGTDQGSGFREAQEGGPPGREAEVDTDLEPLTGPDALFALRVSHPDIRISTERSERGLTLRLHDGISSWATVFTDAAGATVAQEGGRRHLLTEVASGLQRWRAHGSPPLFSFGMSVTPEAQCVWAGTAESGSYRP